MNVVIVGNGGSMRGSQLGELIDSHDVVVRINNYAIYGYEQDVGTKRTIIFRSPKIIAQYILKYATPPERNGGFSGLIDDRHGDFEVAYFQPIRPKQTESQYWSTCKEKPLYKNIKRIEPRYVNELRRNFVLYKYPSTGLLAIHFISSLYGSVSICGFDSFIVDKPPLYSHYFDDTLYDTYGRFHNAEREHVALMAMIDAGRVKILTPPKPLPC